MTLHRTLIATSLAVLLLAAPGVSFGHDVHAHGTTHAAHDATDCDSPIVVGELEISGAFTRATLPNAPVGGGFLTITNKGAADDRLVSAASPASGEVQLHEMAMEGDVMKMRRLADGIPVPAGATVTLQPGGLHMMFIKLAGPMVEGTTVPVTLTFEKAGTVSLELSVQGVGADAPAMDHSSHSDAETEGN
jgi:copper(I)-binding protein